MISKRKSSLNDFQKKKPTNPKLFSTPNHSCVRPRLPQISPAVSNLTLGRPELPCYMLTEFGCKKYKRNRRITMSCWCNLRNLRMAWLRYGRGGFNTEWRSLGEWKNMDIYWTMNNGHGEDFVHCKHRSQLGMEGPWWLGLTRTPERPSGPSGTSSRLNRCRGHPWILQI